MQFNNNDFLGLNPKINYSNDNTLLSSLFSDNFLNTTNLTPQISNALGTNQNGLLQTFTLNQLNQNPLSNQHQDFTNILRNGVGMLDLIGGFAGGLLNLWSQFQNIQLADKKMDLLNQQMKIANEQWNNTKQEIEYTRRARKAITNQFNGNS